MYQQVTFQDFIDTFIKMDRGEQFTYDGFRALFDHLEQIEDDTGEKIVLDVISLCVEYAEYPNAIEAASDYTGEKFTEIEAMKYLEERTTVISFDGGVIVQAY